MTEDQSLTPDVPTSDAPDVRNDTEDHAADRLGLIGMLLSILGVVTCGLWIFSLPGLIVSIIATQKGRTVKGQVGVILGALGAAGFVLVLMIGLLLPALAKARSTARSIEATNQAAQIHEAIGGSRTGAATPGPVTPTSHPGLAPRLYDPDPWGNAYRVKPDPNGGPGHVVTSDGPDGKKGTEDDLRHPPDDSTPGS